MRILVYPHDLEIGGSQLNAIELAAAVRDLGHEVVVFGRRGALNARIDELGLEFVDAPPPGKRPSPTTAAALRRLVRERGIDVIHGYEWPPVLDAVLAGGLRGDPTIVGTVMSMSVPPFIPRSVPLVVGTEQIADHEKERGRARVHVLEPPVDIAHNTTASTESVLRLRESVGLADDALTIVSVARLVAELKLEGTLAAVRAMGRLGQDTPAQLLLVGDGPARAEVARAAEAVNNATAQRTVVLAGNLDDPRPAYALADVALGMGGSALRALSFGAPLIVQGERGFWRALTPESAPDFLWAGWYGVGSGPEVSEQALLAELRPLLADAALRARRGAFGRALVEERFSLDRAAVRQLQIYESALRAETDRADEAIGGAGAAVRYARYYGAKRLRRALGREPRDDFNAVPVAARRRAR